MNVEIIEVGELPREAAIIGNIGQVSGGSLVVKEGEVARQVSLFNVHMERSMSHMVPRYLLGAGGGIIALFFLPLTLLVVMVLGILTFSVGKFGQKVKGSIEDFFSSKYIQRYALIHPENESSQSLTAEQIQKIAINNLGSSPKKA